MGGFRLCLKLSEYTKLAPHSAVLVHWQYKSFIVSDNALLDVIIAFLKQCGQSTRI